MPAFFYILAAVGIGQTLYVAGSLIAGHYRDRDEHPDEQYQPVVVYPPRRVFDYERDA